MRAICQVLWLFNCWTFQVSFVVCTDSFVGSARLGLTRRTEVIEVHPPSTIHVTAPLSCCTTIQILELPIALEFRMSVRCWIVKPSSRSGRCESESLHVQYDNGLRQWRRTFIVNITANTNTAGKPEQKITAKTLQLARTIRLYCRSHTLPFASLIFGIPTFGGEKLLELD